MIRPLGVDLASELPAAFFNGVVGGGRVRLDVAAGERFDVLPGWILRLLGAGAGEDDLLLERRLLVRPKLLIRSPDLFHIHNAHQALRRLLQRAKGWPTSLMSTATTLYYLSGSMLVIYVSDFLQRLGHPD